MSLGPDSGVSVKGSQAWFPEEFCQARSLLFVALQERSKMRFIPKCCAKRLAAFAAIFALTFLAAPMRSLAQGQPPYQDQQGDDQDDPPTRAARLSYTGGAVPFAPAGSDEWVGA